MIQKSSKNSKPLWKLHRERGSVVHPPSNGKGLRDIEHSMSTVLDMGFNIWFIMTLYYKIWQMLLQNGTTILLQNATNVYFLLQNATVLLHNATVITNDNHQRQIFQIAKGDFYYKIWRLLQIATVQTVWVIPST